MSSPTVNPNIVDLTTLDAVKGWLNIPLDNHTDDSDIADVITGFSRYVLNQAGVVSFSIVQQYTETRSGNGNNQMFVRNTPIVNVTAVTVNGVAVPAAGTWPAWGYYVADDKKSILIRAVGSPTGFQYYPTYATNAVGNRGWTFVRGIGNVTLTYNAGYTRVPFDLELAARKASAIHYMRKKTLDLASKAQSAGGTTGTTQYQKWDVPPEVAYVIDYYTRLAVVGA